MLTTSGHQGFLDLVAASKTESNQGMAATDLAQAVEPISEKYNGPQATPVEDHP
jgi:hypothetical protein